nr:zinc finger protein 831 isoform X1 [Nerophis lumbriciformis]XP_061793990.1 zinc finger protein 831 isoform X1 [Nerophis lumbriciformis]
METGKQEIKQAQKEKTAYKRSVPGVSVQAILGSSAGQQEPAKLCLPMPSVYSKETLPFLTLHIVGGLQSQPGLSLAAAAPIAKPKSSGKNVCPHCGRDCMKPSVLEKHLRCHTGERPFPCTVCGVSFKTQSNLYKHKRTQVHARLSYESEQSSVGSLEGISRDSLTPGSSVDECPEESLRLQQEANNVAEITCPVEKHNDFPDEYHKTETKLEAGGTKDREKHGTEQEQPLLNYNRHVPLQRQEATMFSKQWKNSGCKVKSKSHDSIDSGFSEGNDRCSTPAGVMPDHRLETFERSGTDHSEEHINTAGGPAESVRQKEQQALEERISKLISQNTSVVEDKLLENVRPRKTGLSKQGSIDLPMPYTFKDSFHFDMKINKALKVGLQRNKNAGFYRSAPTQYSTTMEHAPLVRSNSLQFSVTPQQPEKICSNVSFQSDFTTPAQRGRSAPGNQQSSAHHPLVRQAAIDCITATETCVTNSSVEEASSASLSFDGDDCDIHGEQKKRKFQRKKSQKFAYNKWYMYRGGSFKKLYSPEKAEDGGVGKSRKMSSSIQEQSILSFITKEADKQVHVAKGNTQLCYSDSSLAKNIHSGVSLQTDNLKSTLRRNLSLSSSPLLATGSLYMHTMDNTERGVDEKHMCGESDRKKQRTEEKVLCSVGMETDRHTSTKTLQLITDAVPEQTANFSYVNEPTNPIQAQVKRDVFSTATVTEAPSRSSAKNTFLPKYQLKLPNSAEPNSTPVAGTEPLTMPNKTTSDPQSVATKVNQTTTVAVKAFSQGNPTLLSYTHASGTSSQLIMVNRSDTTTSSTTTTPCNIVSLDSEQPTGQNVFHVHTADLQICLQIISDEQLALIEPQIEHKQGNTFCQRQVMDKMASGVIQINSQHRVSSADEGGHLVQSTCPKGFDQNQSLSMPHLEKGNPIHLDEIRTEHSVNSLATDLAEIDAREDSLVETTTEAVSSADTMSTAISPRNVNPEGGQHWTFPSSSTASQSSVRSGLFKECHASIANTIETKREPCAQAQVELMQSTNVALSMDLSQIFKEADRQVSVYTNSGELPSPQILASFKRAHSESDGVGQHDGPYQTQGQTPSLDGRSTAQSLTIQDKSITPVTDVPASIQSPIAGHVRGSNMEVCPSQTKHLTRERDTSEGPESAGWRRFDSADANHRYVDMSGGDTGDRRGQKKMEVETLPARRWRTAVSNCRHTEDTVNKEREAAVKVESELAEQHGGISGQELQRATNTANNADFHGNFHVKLSDFPQRTLEMHSDSLSEQPNLQEMHSSLIVSVESTQSLVQSEANARLTQTLQDQNATTSAEKPSPNVDDNAASCFFVKSELQTSPQTPNPSTVAKTQQSTDIGHVCLCGDVSPRHAMTGENNLLEGTSVNQTKTLLRPRTDDQDQAAPESSFQSIHSHGDAGQRHTVFLVDPATECWSGGARPLPSCQEYTEDTSSSDDEGKLIIEL